MPLAPLAHTVLLVASALAHAPAEARLDERWVVEDDACAGEGASECMLSLRQLRGVRTEEPAVQRRDSLSRLWPEPPDSVLGIPLYTHANEDKDSGEDLGTAPRKASLPSEAGRWIVNVANERRPLLGADRDAEGQVEGPVFVVRGNREDLETALQGRADVVFVEEDAVLRAVPELDVGPEKAAEPLLGAGVNVDEEYGPASWGLDRIDQLEGLDHWYQLTGERGEGVHVYMLDSGIRTTHEDFEGRAVPTLEADSEGLRVCRADNTSCALDLWGHGTHTAGTVAGRKYGVAKAATVHACKILNDRGIGLVSWVIQALDYVAKEGQRPAVASASLGGRYESPSLELSLDRAVGLGVTVVVAAGNENDDACQYMPSKVASTITVGAIDMGDNRASYSNHGKCVDIFAPGSAISSAGFTSDNAVATLSGTSMACPHVAGAATLVLAGNHSFTPADVRAALLGEAVAGKVFNAGDGSPNKMLYVRPPLPRPLPLKWPPRLEVYDGPCEVDASGCVSTAGFPDRGYGNEERCNILVVGEVRLRVDAFDTEAQYDAIVVNDWRYSGNLGDVGHEDLGHSAVPQELDCVQPSGSMTWVSDKSDTGTGWRICPEQKPPVDASPGLYVSCGVCSVDVMGCVSSPNFPLKYSNSSQCHINVVGNVGALEVKQFSTEEGSDMLWVNGRSYSGSRGPEGVHPTGRMVWSSDEDTAASGWKLCPKAGTEPPDAAGGKGLAEGS